MTLNRPEIRLRPDGSFDVVRPAGAGERWSWALYDFANTIFSMNIVTLYFSVWIASDLAAGTGGYALATSISSLLVAISIPVFGAISDERRRRKGWVIGLTLLCCAATAAIGVLGHGATSGSGIVMPALALFVVANYAYQGALPFYNAMMPELVEHAKQGRLSGFGTALGYVGSIAGVFLIAPFFNGALPVAGPLAPGVVEAIRQVPFSDLPGRSATFIPTAAMFLLFSLPLFFFCHDHLALPRSRWPRLSLVRPFREVWGALVDTRKHPGLLRFILCSYFYQDAIGTVITFMAVYAVMVMGFARGSEITLFVVLTVPSILGAAVIGVITDRFGPKRTLQWVLAGWTVLIVLVLAAQTKGQFWAVGAMVGFLFGGIGTAERPMLLTLVPDIEAGRYFGLLVLSARAAAIVGPLVWALIVSVVFGDRNPQVAFRVAMGSLAIAMAFAAWLLRKVPDNHAVVRAPEAA